VKNHSAKDVLTNILWSRAAPQTLLCGLHFVFGNKKSLEFFPPARRAKQQFFNCTMADVVLNGVQWVFG
jgi:hypothetical protein